jgi:hypothetical protein
MAVGNSKRLHVHSIPVLVVSVGVLLVTCIGASELGFTKNNSSADIQKVSTTGLLSVRSLFRGSLNGNSQATHTTDATAGTTAQAGTLTLGNVDSVGRNLQYDMTISQ